MVQPYVHAIYTSGERALVFIKDRFLHVIRKNAVLSVGLHYNERRDAHPGTEPWQANRAALALADVALSAIPQRRELPYARVDMIVEPNGTAILTDLELVEPTLYLRFHPSICPPWLMQSSKRHRGA